MLVGIHINTKGSIQPFTRGYQKVLEYNGIKYVMMNIEDAEFVDKLNELEAFIFQVGHTSDSLQMAFSFMPILQRWRDLRVYPDFDTLWTFDDKIKQHYLNLFLNLGFAESWVFWSRKVALRWLQNVEYPIVMKLKGGAGSTNVVKLDDYRIAKKLLNNLFSKGVSDSSFPASWRVRYLPLKRYFRTQLIAFKRRLVNEDISRYWQNNKNYAYFQKYLPGNKYDTRVTVIGGRAFAFRRFNRKNDFRASGSGKISYDIEAIDLTMVKTALTVSKKLGFQCMAYDFLYDVDSPVICEISYSFIDELVYRCPGYWDEKLEWHEGHYMPQYFILKDLLGLDIKQPSSYLD